MSAPGALQHQSIVRMTNPAHEQDEPIALFRAFLDAVARSFKLRIPSSSARYLFDRLCSSFPSPPLPSLLQTFDGGDKWSVRTFGNLDEEEEINYRFQKVGTRWGGQNAGECSISG